MLARAQRAQTTRVVRGCVEIPRVGADDALDVPRLVRWHSCTLTWRPAGPPCFTMWARRGTPATAPASVWRSRLRRQAVWLGNARAAQSSEQKRVHAHELAHTRRRRAALSSSICRSRRAPCIAHVAGPHAASPGSMLAVAPDWGNDALGTAQTCPLGTLEDAGSPIAC
ncbi:hypothetical protein CERSUDRAFT_100160 [Gelatoporia subvermispora B]|uniref:Uncharacterized protein n=1 Tax=Ceriporiopsis subvermispora (strain B) TaxID=914234 RepID=M2R0B2_CERS8|nr:hypothetical protein CERSUDRAFT_100160 [Gelatoporia subvermispora B]